MISIIGSILIVALLGLNHYEHGFGCWGFQPGGHTSMRLYAAQILIALYAVIHASMLLKSAKPSAWQWLCLVLLICMGGVVVILFDSGSVIFSSVHHQGIENLIPFSSATFTALFGGVIIFGCRKILKKKVAEQGGASDR